MGTDQKRTIVVSAVNFSEFGPLSILRESLDCLGNSYGDRYRIVALVHKRHLVSDLRNIEYLEFPDIKASWTRRLIFEFITCNRLSHQLQPYLWLSLHDISSRVTAEKQAVYCHNPSPFYKISLREAMLEPKFALFNKMYAFAYAVNINSNDYVIVQQEWMRQEFEERYGLSNVIVAHPETSLNCSSLNENDNSRGYRFIYPCSPRVFKNVEVLLSASRMLERERFNFEVLLTFSGNENRYSRYLKTQFGDVSSAKYLGRLHREELFAQYRRSDCLIFPSKLETWGLPITEFKKTSKLMLLADLPYAHETVGDYDGVHFFPPNDPSRLAALMRRAMKGALDGGGNKAVGIRQPFASGWSDLFAMLLCKN